MNLQNQHSIEQLLLSLATKIELSKSNQLLSSSISQQMAEAKQTASTQNQNLEKKLAEQKLLAESATTDIVLIRKQLQTYSEQQ